MWSAKIEARGSVSVCTQAMATLSEGSTASIVVYETEGFLGLIRGPRVAKLYKKHVTKLDRDHERDIHTSVVYLLRDCALKAPMLEYVRDALVMERVDTSRPLWEEKEVSDEHIEVLVEGLTALLWEGYEMRDVEVYVQPDGSLRMLDFGQVTTRPYPLHAATMVLSATIVPMSEVERLEMAWATKLLPPVAQKDPCTRGCCCSCCMKCSRQKCLGCCGTVRKVKTLHELYSLKYDDLQLGNCTRKEWSERNSLHMHVDRHLRWHHHTWYSGSHQMPDGTYAYLYLTGGGSEGEKPVYQTQAWKDWVTTYRAEFWEQHWGLDYQPICAKDCQLCLPHCGCGELFHGMKLVEGKLVPDVETPVSAPAEAPTPAPAAKAEEDDEDEIEQLSRLAPKKQDYMTVEEFRRRYR